MMNTKPGSFLSTQSKVSSAVHPHSQHRDHNAKLASRPGIPPVVCTAAVAAYGSHTGSVPSQCKLNTTPVQIKTGAYLQLHTFKVATNTLIAEVTDASPDSTKPLVATEQLSTESNETPQF